MKKILALLLCLSFASLLLAGCTGDAPVSSAPESSAVESSAPEASLPESSAPESSAPESSAPESSTPEPTEVPNFLTAGQKIDVPGDLLSDIEAFSNLCYAIGVNFDWENIEDSTMAFCAMLLCSGLEELDYQTRMDEGLCGIDGGIFERALFNYFGRELKDREALNSNFPSYVDGNYWWYPMGLEDANVFTVVNVYDLGGDYYRAEGFADHYAMGEEMPVEQNPATIIVKKTADSSYGFYFIAQRFGL